MAENLTVSEIIPTSVERLFAAWLEPAEHARMTGAPATSARGGRFTAWDGYIVGRTLAARRPAKIVQAWRTSEFPDDAEDSTLTLLLEPAEGGTRLTLLHENVPRGQGLATAEGWRAHYFLPMKAYFRRPTRRAAPSPRPTATRAPSPRRRRLAGARATTHAARARAPRR